MLDYHIHTRFSEDSTTPPDAVCSRACELGLTEIAITDHMDLDWPNKPYRFEIEDLDQYVKTVQGLKQTYAGKLTVRLGIEMGLRPHTLAASREIIKRYPFDYVIASIHIVDGMDPYLPQYYEHRDKVRSYTDYYDAIWAQLQSYDDFQVLAHLDYLRRYSVYPYDAKDHTIGLEIVEAILKHLIVRGKGIELNTSGYRHSSHQPLPHLEIIKLYRDLGGELITLGSDAHEPSHIGYGFDRAIAGLKSCGFTSLTTYSEGQPSFIKI